MVTKRAYSIQKEPKLFQLLGKSAQLLRKVRDPGLHRMSWFWKPWIGQTNCIFWTVFYFESLAYSHSLVPHWTSRWCPNSSAWNLQLLIIRLCFYAYLLHRTPFPLVSMPFALNQLPWTLLQCDEWIPEKSTVEGEGAGTLAMNRVKWQGRTYAARHPGFRDSISRSKCFPVPSVVWYHMVAKVDSGLVINRNHSGWLEAQDSSSHSGNL